MTTAADIAANVAAVRARMRAAAERAGRDPEAVTLIAITKTVGPPAVEALLAAGVADIGENRTAELKKKQDAFASRPSATQWPGEVGVDAARWHFVGHLQTNKVKDAVGRVALIHSIDSEHLMAAIDARSGRMGTTQAVLIEVNLGHEISKYGVDERGAEALCRAARDYPNVQLRGLMTMAPLVEPEGTRPVFAAARRLFDHLGRAGYPRAVMDTLSMGMTNDFEVAIEEGATCVRIGTALFASGTAISTSVTRG